MWLYRLMLVLCGAVIFSITVHDIFFTPSTEQIVRQREEFARWPSVMGEMEELFYQREHNYARGERWWFVVARYRYRVDGVDYVGTRFAPQRVRDTSTVGLDRQLILAGLIEQRNVIDRVPSMEPVPHLPLLESTPRETLVLADKRVRVFYNPVNPAEALLDNRYREPWSAGRSAFFYFLGLAVSLWIMYLGVFGMTARANRRARGGESPAARVPTDDAGAPGQSVGSGGSVPNPMDRRDDWERKPPRGPLPPIEFERPPEERRMRSEGDAIASPPSRSDEAPERRRLAAAAYDIADRYRAERFPELAGLPWEQAWDRMISMLRARCPGFSAAEYEKALEGGFHASR